MVRDRALPRLRGKYVFGDLCDSRAARGIRARRALPRRAGARRAGANLASFGEDSRGEVFAVSLSGPVYRLRR